MTAGSGQNPARQAMMKAGVAQETPALTINAVCGSGLKAVMLAAQYFVVGVLGKSASTARYSLVARREEAIVTLQEGLAMRDQVGAKEYKFFSIKVTEPSADLSLFLTSFTGDADLFVAAAPKIHPSQENHTWASTGYGSDSLSIQAEEMKEWCTPDPARGVACDFFIGILG